MSGTRNHKAIIGGRIAKGPNRAQYRLASVGILGKKKKTGSRQTRHGNFDTGFERNIVILFKIPCAGFFEIFRNSDCLLV